jgi:N-acetylglucosaminyl-diphospho-decaprenol L-rhamnosyltransferase
VSGEPAVAIAVVSWNTRELLGRCLDSMRPAAESGLARIWVVDNASEDGSVELVQERFPWVDLIAGDRNLGFGAAVNEVARRSSSIWLAASNADVELRPGALEALLAGADGDPGAGALAPRLIAPDGETQHSVHPFPTVSLALKVNLGLAALAPGLGDRLCLEGRWDPERGRRVDWAHGAFLLVRRDGFVTAGGFDPGQWMYAEDLDLAWRLGEAGFATRYVPGARVDHEGGAATRKAFADERMALHTAAAQDWMARRQGAGAARAYAAINALGGAVRLLALVPLAWLAPARFAARRTLEGRYLRLHLAGLRSPAAR